MVSLLNTGFAQPEGPWPSAAMVTTPPHPTGGPGPELSQSTLPGSAFVLPNWVQRCF